jgi:hypothetical protein
MYFSFQTIARLLQKYTTTAEALSILFPEMRNLDVARNFPDLNSKFLVENL